MSQAQQSRTIIFSALGTLVLGGLVLWRVLTKSNPPPTSPEPAAPQLVAQPAPPPPPAPILDEDLPPEKIEPRAQLGLGAKVTEVEAHRTRRVVELPKDLSLGAQVITLRGGEWQLQVTISLSSEDPQFVRRAAPLRGKLIEMLYFLVSHRVPESLRTPSGEDRLRDDLHSRFSNLLRTKNFELYFDALSLEAKELPPDFEEDDP